MFHLSTLSAHVSAIVRHAIATLARLGPSGVVSGAVLVAISVCVERRLGRFRRLMVRIAAGHAPVRRGVVEAGVSETEPGGVRVVRVRRVSLVPRGYAWAVKMAQETASLGGQLQAMLAEPEVVAMLERHPEAVAILKPLCRMLAAELPEAVRPASRETTPRVRRAPLLGRPPGDELWPGVRVWRERRAASDLAAAKRLVRPPWRRFNY